MHELVRIKDCLERDLSACIGASAWLVCNWGDGGWTAQHHPHAGEEPVAGSLFTRPIGYWAEWACFADRTPALRRFLVHASNAGHWLASNRMDRAGTFLSPSICSITSRGEIDWLAAIGRWSAEPEARGHGLDRYFWHEGKLLPYSWDLNQLAQFSCDEKWKGLLELATDWEHNKPHSHVVVVKDIAMVTLAFIDYLIETQPQLEERWRRMIDVPLVLDGSAAEVSRSTRRIDSPVQESLTIDEFCDWPLLNSPNHACAGATPIAVLSDGRKLQIGEGPPFVIPNAADTVLRALIEAGGAASKDELVQTSGKGDAPRVLKGVCEKFPQLKQFIKLPGGKDRGGYRTTITLSP